MHQVSVIVPIYNAEPYLAKCIESLINQDYNALQIILVNDGSTDNSLAIAEQYAGNDDRIEVYSQANQGQSMARNLGLEHAKGAYISFVDADDYIDTDFYSYMLEHIGERDCVQIGYRRVTNKGKVLQEKLPKHFYQFTSPWGRLYRRNVFEKNNLAFPIGMIYEDVVFSLDFWATRPSYKILSYTGYNYLANVSSTTATGNLAAKELLFSTLKKKRKKSKSFRQKMLITYTMLRLKIHFLK